MKNACAVLVCFVAAWQVVAQPVPEVGKSASAAVAEVAPPGPMWQPFGPSAIDKRLGHKTPGFGVFRCVDSHPRYPDVVIMGGDTTGLWKSPDAGKTWKLVSHALPFDQVYAVRFAPGDPRVVWAFTNKGVVISRDSGDTWAFTALAKPESSGDRMHGLIVVSPADPLTALAYTDKKVHRSTDGGKTWTVVIDNVLVRDLEFHPRAGQFAYVAGGEGGKGNQLSVMVSVDGGLTFKPSGTPMQFREIHRASLAVSPAKPDAVWMMVFGDRLVKTGDGEKTAMFGGFFRSDNRGMTFAAVPQASGFKPEPDGMLAWPSGWPVEAEKKSFDPKNDTSFMIMSLAQIGWDHALAVSDKDAGLIVAGGTGCAFSRDGGLTWTKENEGEGIHADIQDAVIRGSRLWVVHDGGLNRVELGGGKILSSQIDGYRGQQLWGFGMSFKSGVAALGVNHSTIKVIDPRTYEGFYSAGGADAQTAFVNLFDDKWVYGTPWWNEVIRRPLTLEEKTPWRRSAVDFGYVPYRTPEPHPNLAYSFFALHKETDPNDPHRTVAQQVARSDDNFQSIRTLWRREGGYARRLRVCLGHPDTMMVISGPDNKVEITGDGGKSWRDITPPEPKAKFADMAIDADDPARIWLCRSDKTGVKKLLRSRDGGRTWEDYSQGLDASEARVMVFQRGSKGGVYLGCRPGVWFRDDTMPAWVRHDSGLPFTNVSFLQIDYAAGKIRAGTNQGAWEAPLARDFEPRALIAASHNHLTPSTGTVVFYCHSALPAAGAKWEWSFPGGTPTQSTEENPRVTYDMSDPTSHDVILKVTDARGRSSECRLEKFISSGEADEEIGKLKDVLLGVASPDERFGADQSKFVCRKLPDQSEADFNRAEAERIWAKQLSRREMFSDAGDDDSLRFTRPEAESR